MAFNGWAGDCGRFPSNAEVGTVNVPVEWKYALTPEQSKLKKSIYLQVYGSRRGRPRMSREESKAKFDRYCELLKEAGIPPPNASIPTSDVTETTKAPAKPFVPGCTVEASRNEWAITWRRDGYY